MPWITKHDPAHDLVEVIYCGKVTGEELRLAASSRITLEKQMSTTRILVDATEITELAATMVDLINLPDKQYDNEQANRRDRMALVVPDSEESDKIARFFETVCFNRGWMVKSFEDRASAVAWLADDNKTNYS